MKLFLYFLVFLSFFSFSCKNKEKTSESSLNLVPQPGAVSNLRPQPAPRPQIPNFVLHELSFTGQFRLKEKAIEYGLPAQDEFWIGRFEKIEYCFFETRNKKGLPSYKENIRARLYDKNGKMLFENFLRYKSFNESFQGDNVIVYLPYHKDIVEIRVVRLEGNKEIIIHILSDIKTLDFLKEKVKSSSEINYSQMRGGGSHWVYDEDRQCFFYLKNFM